LLEGAGIEALHVFGSVARGEARPHSDVDILVDMTGERTFDRYFTLKERLEALLGTRDDVVMRDALRPAWRRVIEEEAVRVA
jgi:uncharacterized protein